MIGREQILALIPHAGRMCLIERVLRWSEAEILCESDNHRDPAHPLRRAGGLAAVCLIEYGAQAAAIHGALLAPDQTNARRSGMLVSVRDCELAVDCLHDLRGPLRLDVRCELARTDGLIYFFEATNRGHLLARGRISILLAIDS